MQVVDPSNQTPQRQSIAKPATTPLYSILDYNGFSKKFHGYEYITEFLWKYFKSTSIVMTRSNHKWAHVTIAQLNCHDMCKIVIRLEFIFLFF